jgi:hypothetical protein
MAKTQPPTARRGPAFRWPKASRVLTRRDELEEFQRDYEDGDLTGLYGALAALHDQKAVPMWLLVALIECVDGCLERRKASQTRSQFARLRAFAEDCERSIQVHQLRERGVKPNAAYRTVAAARAKATGTNVSHGAIQKSCERVARQPVSSLGAFYRMGMFLGLPDARTGSRITVPH